MCVTVPVQNAARKVLSASYLQRSCHFIALSEMKIESEQESLAVASIARDDPSPLPGMHGDHNAQCMRAHCGLQAQCAVNLDRNLKPKLAIMRMHSHHRQTDRQTDERTLTS